jgi:hypothetical protein
LKLANLRRLRGAAVTSLIVLLLATAAHANEPEPLAEPAPDTPWYTKAADIGAMTFDVVLLRPLGFAATAGGLVCFAVASPFSAIAQEIGTSWDIFVLGPADYTFTRPLGDF